MYEVFTKKKLKEILLLQSNFWKELKIFRVISNSRDNFEGKSNLNFVTVESDFIEYLKIGKDIEVLSMTSKITLVYEREVHSKNTKNFDRLIFRTPF